MAGANPIFTLQRRAGAAAPVPASATGAARRKRRDIPNTLVRIAPSSLPAPPREQVARLYVWTNATALVEFYAVPLDHTATGRAQVSLAVVVNTTQEALSASSWRFTAGAGVSVFSGAHCDLCGRKSLVDLHGYDGGAVLAARLASSRAQVGGGAAAEFSPGRLVQEEEELLRLLNE